MSVLRSLASRIQGIAEISKANVSRTSWQSSWSMFSQFSQSKQNIIQRQSDFQFQFVRYATKKAQSSRTNDSNSKGKRLGLKAAEGSFVKTGEIIFRQRGTQFYPGENAGIGRDHTVFALEPGYVRYYRNPFHPKRKFIGVAIRPGARLPSPHWQPRVRRLGLVPLTDPQEIERERTHVSTREYRGRILKKQRIQQEIADKAEKAKLRAAKQAAKTKAGPIIQANTTTNKTAIA
ncbi:ribosomal L27 protein-domain-containing protein [Lipomyces japonicus]|uniref:mitochondrial 54S ribosomal protein bL27m n=1 Tax=Lipomyces japonicus TaxID=56871 RepID=UPI0034CF811E